MNAHQGPIYCGTGRFHQRKALYGIPPDVDPYNNKDVREFHNHDAKGKDYQ